MIRIALASIVLVMASIQPSQPRRFTFSPATTCCVAWDKHGHCTKREVCVFLAHGKVSHE